MNKIPKLEIKQIYWTPRGLDLYNDDSGQYHDFICPDNLKEVNAFRDKYKDSPYDFFYDYKDLELKESFLIYLKEQKVNVKKVYVNEIPFNMGLSLNKKATYFNDWLHDYLYKVE